MNVNMKLVSIGSTIASAAVGALAGYFFAKRRLEAQYVAQTQLEIAQAKAYLNELYKRENAEDLNKPAREQKLRDDAARVLRQQLPTATADLERIRDGLKYGKPESVSESKDHPYIIDENVFMAGDEGYEQITLTWFSEDETLVNDGEQIISDLEITVGRDNLFKWDEQADPSVTYVRNDIQR